MFNAGKDGAVKESRVWYQIKIMQGYQSWTGYVRTGKEKENEQRPMGEQ